MKKTQGHTYAGERIWLIGASSGIGAALARELCRRGAKLLVSARSLDALHALTDELGPAHDYKVMDLSQVDQIPLWVEEVHRDWGPIDRVVYLAALYEPERIETLELEKVQSLFTVNVVAAIAVAQALLPLLKQRPLGQLVMVSSVAGWLGLPNAQPYAATKAALTNFTESLAAEVGGEVDIKLVNPGFVDTPLTQKNAFKMPFCLTAEEAARRMADGLLTNRFEIHFPKRFTCWVKFLSGLPYSLQLAVCKRIQ